MSHHREHREQREKTILSPLWLKLLKSTLISCFLLQKFWSKALIVLMKRSI